MSYLRGNTYDHLSPSYHTANNIGSLNKYSSQVKTKVNDFDTSNHINNMPQGLTNTTGLRPSPEYQKYSNLLKTNDVGKGIFDPFKRQTSDKAEVNQSLNIQRGYFIQPEEKKNLNPTTTTMMLNQPLPTRGQTNNNYSSNYIKSINTKSSPLNNLTKIIPTSQSSRIQENQKIALKIQTNLPKQAYDMLLAQPRKAVTPKTQNINSDLDIQSNNLNSNKFPGTTKHINQSLRVDNDNLGSFNKQQTNNETNKKVVNNSVSNIRSISAKKEGLDKTNVRPPSMQPIKKLHIQENTEIMNNLKNESGTIESLFKQKLEIKPNPDNGVMLDKNSPKNFAVKPPTAQTQIVPKNFATNSIKPNSNNSTNYFNNINGHQSINHNANNSNGNNHTSIISNQKNTVHMNGMSAKQAPEHKDIESNNTSDKKLDEFVTKVSKGDVFGKKFAKNNNDQSPPIKNEKKKEKPNQQETVSGNNNAAKFFISPNKQHSQKMIVNNAEANPSQQFDEPANLTYYMPSLQKAIKNKYSIARDFLTHIYREHFVQSFQALKFCRNLKPADPKMLASKKLLLQRREKDKNKRTIVFDLDETLIHCNESKEIPSDVILPIRFPTGEIIEAGINVRPYAIECLQELSKHYEIIVFTASHSCYASVVLDYLDPKKELITHRLFRDNCVQTEEGMYIKDLRVLGQRNLNEVLIVDNAAYSFGYQIENGIPCIPFYDNKNDNELKHLVGYLKYLMNVPDFVQFNKNYFRMHLYCNEDNPDALIEKLFKQNVYIFLYPLTAPLNKYVKE